MNCSTLQSRRTVNVCFGKATRALAVSFALLMICLPVCSQVNLGRIGGTITDQTGGAIAGATVTVLDVERGVPRTLTTDDAGAYTAPNLIPGGYTVRVEAKGFNTIERKDLDVGVGQDVRVDLTLKPGETNAVITVTGEMPAINTTNAQLGGIIENQTIEDLPVAGRTFLYLLNYRPGVQTKPGAGGGIIQYTNGIRAEYNLYVFDGLPDSNPYNSAGPINIGFIAGGPDESVILPLDAVQEFNTVENPKAEYGWRPAAQISMGLKSGTNSIHGTAFATGRNQDLAAKNPFFSYKPSTAFEQFGATVSGPIKKDKLFYLVGYEGVRYDVANPRVQAIPTSISLGGSTSNSIPDALYGLDVAKIAPSQLSLNLAGCTQTIAQIEAATSGAGITCNAAQGVFGNNTNALNLQTNFPDEGKSDNGVAKLDYHMNDHHNFNIDLLYGTGFVNAPVGSTIQPYWESPIYAEMWVARVVWNWIPSPTWVNEVRFGDDHLFQGVNTAFECASGSISPNYQALGYVGTNVCGFPSTTISGFNGTSPLLGNAQGISSVGDILRWSDNLSHTHGQHQFKFGVEFADNIWDGDTTPNAFKGTISFGAAGASAFTGATALEDFMAGSANAATLLVGKLHRSINYWQYASYVQDDWRATSKLTLNLGLRWEYTQPITEANNLWGNFDASSPTGIIQATSSNPEVYSHNHKAFAPRLGLAWDVTGKGTTVVHATGNMAYFHATGQGYTGTGSTLQSIPTGLPLYSPNGTSQTTPGGTVNLTTLAISPSLQPDGITSAVPWTVGTPEFGSVTAVPGCGNGLAPTVGAAKNPPPCTIGGENTNAKNPYYISWGLGIQHAFTNSLSLDVSYVGNHGGDLRGWIDLNAPTPGISGTSSTAAPGSCVGGGNNVIGLSNEQCRRPFNNQFPWFSEIRYDTNFLMSNYNGLQAYLNQRVAQGLTFGVGYTWSHSLDEESGEVGPVGTMDAANPRLDYGNSIQDVRNRFTLNATYNIPGKTSPGQLLQGWQVNTAAQLWGRQPIGALDGADDFSGTGTAATGPAQDRWDISGNPNNFVTGGPGYVPCWGVTGSTFAKATATENGVSVPACTVVPTVSAMPQACQTASAALPTNPTVVAAGDKNATGTLSLTNFGCYMMGNSVIVPPAQGTFGNMERYSLRAHPFRVWDMSVQKNWKLKERLTTQFQIQCFNVLNSAQYALPTATLNTPGTFGQSTSTPNIAGNSPIIGNGDARRFQLGLKFMF